MILCMIAAMSENRVIGRDGSIPWRLRDEQQAVKKLTMGHCLLMGRKTWESFGRPLPGRTSIVITRNTDYEIAPEHASCVVLVPSLPAAIDEAKRRGDDLPFVFGGAGLYAEALAYADRLHLTRVHAEIEGDQLFPEFDESAWRLVDESHYAADERNEYAYTMQVFERSTSASLKSGEVTPER